MAGRVEERYSMRAPLTPKFEGGQQQVLSRALIATGRMRADRPRRVGEHPRVTLGMLTPLPPLCGAAAAAPWGRSEGLRQDGLTLDSSALPQHAVHSHPRFGDEHAGAVAHGEGQMQIPGALPPSAPEVTSAIAQRAGRPPQVGEQAASRPGQAPLVCAHHPLSSQPCGIGSRSETTTYFAAATAPVNVSSAGGENGRVEARAIAAIEEESDEPEQGLLRTLCRFPHPRLLLGAMLLLTSGMIYLFAPGAGWGSRIRF